MDIIHNNTLPSTSAGNNGLAVCYLTISLLVIVTNSVVIYVIIKTKELQVPTLWIIAHMAVWDLLLGLHYLVFAVPSAFLNKFAYSKNLVAFVTVSRVVIVGQNMFSTVLMMLDRLVIIKKPLSYNRLATKKSFVIALLVSIPLNIGRVLLIVLPADRFFYNRSTAMCMPDISIASTSVGSTIHMIVTLVTIIICSAAIFNELLRSSRLVNLKKAPPLIGKFSLMALVSATVFCISYLPSVVAVVWNYFNRGGVPHSFSRFVMVSLLCNSVWNVIIYTFTYRPFKNALLSIFCKSYYRRQRQKELQVCTTITT